jgi:hypothetical protein
LGVSLTLNPIDLKKIIFILTFFILTSFTIDTDTKNFKVTYFDKIEVIGVHEDDLPQYVINLNCTIDGQLFYQADPDEEFEFENRIWEQAKQIDKDKYQLLLELNDRPNKNKIVLLTIQNKKLISKQIIPTFDSCFVVDGKTKEYQGELEYAEAVDKAQKTQYIPTLFYLDKQSGIVLDTAKTIIFNTDKWGKFYGFKPDFNLILTPKH